MASCGCHSALNVLVCRGTACHLDGRFIASAPFIAGALAFPVAALAAVLAFGQHGRRTDVNADRTDFADYVSETVGAVTSVFLFVIGVVVVLSSDNLPSVSALVGLLACVPLVAAAAKLLTVPDVFIYVREQRHGPFGWPTIALISANLVAVFLVFLII